MNTDDFITSTVTCERDGCAARGESKEVAHPEGGLVVCGTCGATLLERTPIPDQEDTP